MSRGWPSVNGELSVNFDFTECVSLQSFEPIYTRNSSFVLLERTLGWSRAWGESQPWTAWAQIDPSDRVTRDSHQRKPFSSPNHHRDNHLDMNRLVHVSAAAGRNIGGPYFAAFEPRLPRKIQAKCIKHDERPESGWGARVAEQHFGKAINGAIRDQSSNRFCVVSAIAPNYWIGGQARESGWKEHQIAGRNNHTRTNFMRV